MDRPSRAPCKDCPERHPGCHGTCERGYREWRAMYEAAKARERRGVEATHMIVEAIQKNKKRTRNHKKK